MTLPSGFHDVRFPLRIGFGARGGPRRPIEIVQLTNGFEKRNQRTAHSRRSYDVGPGLKSVDDLQLLLSFFEERRGPLFAFRFRDPLDYSTAEIGQDVATVDVSLGTGDGQNRRFRLIKKYGSSDMKYERPISCAVAQTLRVEVGGAEVPASTYNIDEPGQAIVFKTAHVPEDGARVRAGFEFDVPVRFDADNLDISLAAFRAGEVASAPLREVLL